MSTDISPQLPQTEALEQSLFDAVARHQAGELQEAEKRYRAILQIDPGHAKANHNMGVLLVQLQQAAAGVPYFMAALEANPTQGQYWLSCIDALYLANQKEDALQLLALARQHGLQGDDVEALAQRLEGSVPNAEQSGAEHQAVTQDAQSDTHQGKEPDSPEISRLVALFSSGRYAEAAQLAKEMTVRFPQHGMGWKALGAAYMQMGKGADALAPMQKAAALFPDDPETHNNLGIVLYELGRSGDAEASYRRALHFNPADAGVHCNLGAALHKSGRLDEAEASFRHALQIDPAYAKAHSNLGVIFQESGQLDQAEASYRQAMQIQPDDAEANYNLGITLKELGRLAEAEANCRRALQINPHHAEAYYNLGNILFDLNRLDEAEASYRQALQTKPDFVGVLNNIALMLDAQGKSVPALNAVRQSLQIEETGLAKSVFVACIKRLHLTQDDSEIRSIMVRALTEPWGRPNELAQISIALVKLTPEIKEYITRASNAWPQRISAQDLFDPDGLGAVATDTLLSALLDAVPICDIDMERFLTLARHALLAAASGGVDADGAEDPALIFYSALARQCFINEYVFTYTENEIQEAGELRDSLIAALESGTQVPVLWPVAVAAYFPLYSLPSSHGLLERQWPDAVMAVLVQQLREPAEEMQLRATIPRLTNVEDKVSLLVQSQYEENPYPRWIKTAPASEAKNIVGYLCQKFPLASFDRRGKNGSIDVLIAGCGTGQQSIATAQRIQGAQLLAVDLSISSLAYAKRKTRELGLTTIDYSQADLLQLGSIDRDFDIIESCGVLHHLADPWAGWRVLLSRLRPGGFMKIGLYSEVARSEIVRIRSYIAENGYGSTANEIRQCRQDLMDQERSADFGSTLKSPDFFSISTCRDLLFHVQEQRMTLTGIEEFLRANDLVFIGFEMEGNVLQAYKQRFPDDRAATNLFQWQVFENEHPDIFANMYQFWIQKKV